MKHMKKSMFITTLIMTVVLVVALSTATFAWYTANTAVGATKVNVTSANSTTASLVIDNQVASANDTWTSVDLTMTNAQGANVPMVYASADAELPSVGTTTFANFITKFVTFTRDAGSKFASPVATATPDVISAVSGHGTPNSYIVLTNVGGAQLSSLSTRVTIEPFYVYTEVQTPAEANMGTYYEIVNNEYVKTADTEPAGGGKKYYTRSNGNDYLRVAVFASTTDNGDYILKGIYGAGTNTQIANRSNLMQGDNLDTSKVTVGETAIGTAVGEAVFPLTASGGAVALASNVNAGNAIFVKVAVWFEGNSMANADANQIAAFSMSFGA